MIPTRKNPTAIKPITPPTPPQEFETDSWGSSRGHFIGLHGQGGAGKTTLAAMLQGKTLFIDLEGSLKIIKPKLDELGVTSNISPKFLSYNADAPSEAWTSLLEFLRSCKGKPFDNIVIDSFTRAQEWCAQNLIATIPAESISIRNSIEQWTYGKGRQIVYDNFLPIYDIIDKLQAEGKNILAITHTEATRFTNADGGDFWQNQPRLVQGEKGQAPGRATFLEKVDHLLFLSADISVEKGKAKGGMTRTLYTGGIASMMAKSRTVQGESFDVMPGEIFDWSQIIKN